MGLSALKLFELRLQSIFNCSDIAMDLRKKFLSLLTRHMQGDVDQIFDLLKRDEFFKTLLGSLDKLYDSAVQGVDRIDAGCEHIKVNFAIILLLLFAILFIHFDCLLHKVTDRHLDLFQNFLGLLYIFIVLSCLLLKFKQSRLSLVDSLLSFDVHFSCNVLHQFIVIL